MLSRSKALRVGLFFGIVATFLVLPGSAGTLLDPGGVIESIVADTVRNSFYVTLETDEVVSAEFGATTVNQRIPVAENPGALAVSPDGSRLYVALETTHDVAVFSLPSMAYQSTIDLSPDVYTISEMIATQTRLYVWSHASFSIVDTNTGAELFFGDISWLFLIHRSYLALSPDEQSLMALTTGLSPASLYSFSLENDIPFQTGENCCHTCLESDGRDVAFSADGSMAYVLTSGFYLQVLNREPTGMMNTLHHAVLGGHPKALVQTPDDSLIFVGVEDTIAAVRSSDWLAFHVSPLQGEVMKNGLVLSQNGENLAAAVDSSGFNDPDTIETIATGDLQIANRGGIRMRPLDSENGQPISTTWTEIVNSPSYGSSGFVDVTSGTFAHGPLEPGSYEVEVDGGIDYPSLTRQTPVTAGQWTELGDLIFTRTGGVFPPPTNVCVSPGAVIGGEAQVKVHGMSFDPQATIDRENQEITLSDWAWENWSTISTTISVSSNTSPGVSRYSVRVTNPDDEFDRGHIFFIEPNRHLTLTTSTLEIQESTTPATLQVQRLGETSGTASVSFRTNPGTATPGADYTASTGLLIWADGDGDPKQIQIDITQDSDPEGDENFTVELYDPQDAELGDIAETTVTIIDDDVSYIGFAASPTTVLETDPTIDLAVTRAGNLDHAVTVEWSTQDGTAVTPDDYVGVLPTTLSWAIGDNATKYIQVSIVDDLELEQTETFGVVLDNPSEFAVLDADSSTVTVEIVDDDHSIVHLSSAAYAGPESDLQVVVTVERNGPPNGEVSVLFSSTDGTATAGEDYVAQAETLSWSDGDSSTRVITIPLVADLLIEGDEAFTVTLSNITGPDATIEEPSSATVTITDTTNIVNFSDAGLEIDEQDGAITFSVVRSGVLDGAVSVDYQTFGISATDGVDFVPASGTLSWPAGSGGSQDITVTILDDVAPEGGETFQVNLSNLVGIGFIGAPSELIVSINDNEWHEFQVNTTTMEQQTRPDVGMDGSGRFVAVWDSYNQDGEGWGVYGRRFAADGSPLTGELSLASRLASDQRDVAVAVAPNGSFVAVWESWTYPTILAATSEIAARFFDSSGAPIGSEVRINQDSGGKHRDPAIAVDGSGNYMVLWSSLEQDGSGETVMARMLSSSGTPFGNEFQVNLGELDDQHLPAVAGLAGGGFIAVWESVDQYSGGADIVARRYSSSGASQSGEMLVNDETWGYQQRPEIAVWPSGQALVVWQDRENRDGDGYSIRARRLAAGGGPIDPEWQVNDYPTSDQKKPVVAIGHDSSALVAWQSMGQDGSSRGVFFRMVHISGAMNDEVRANVRAANSQYLAAATRFGDSSVLVWASGDQDGSGDGIFAWHGLGFSGYFPDIFASDFESGDFSDWTAVQ